MGTGNNLDPARERNFRCQGRPGVQPTNGQVEEVDGSDEDNAAGPSCPAGNGKSKETVEDLLAEADARREHELAEQDRLFQERFDQQAALISRLNRRLEEMAERRSMGHPSPPQGRQRSGQQSPPHGHNFHQTQDARFAGRQESRPTRSPPQLTQAERDIAYYEDRLQELKRSRPDRVRTSGPTTPQRRSTYLNDHLNDGSPRVRQQPSGQYGRYQPYNSPPQRRH
jgi:hypothetical protein